MTSARTITVALVEDDLTTRQRLEAVLAKTPNLTLVFTATTGAEAMEWLREGRPDVLLADLGLPDLSGIEVIKRCRSVSPVTEIMVITMFGDESNMLAAFEAGARGYLLKDGTEEELAHHVMDLHTGGSPMSPLIARQLVARISLGKESGNKSPQPPTSPAAARAQTDLSDALSPREQEILMLLSRGYTYPELSKLLGVALSTIQTHVKSIYSKLAVHSKTEAVFEARQMGLLEP